MRNKTGDDKITDLFMQHVKILVNIKPYGSILISNTRVYNDAKKV